MPSHPDRVRRNYCEHEFKYIFGVDIAHMYVAAKMCIKCKIIIRLGYPGIDKIERGWYDSEATRFDYFGLPE